VNKDKSEPTSEHKDFDKVNKAVHKMNSGDLKSAKAILREVITNTPTDYTNKYEKDGNLFIKFWDQEAYMHFGSWILTQGDGKKNNLYWVVNAYPRAYYYLGYIHSEEGDYQKAIELFDEGLRLESTNPNFKLEKAAAYHSMGDYKKAVLFYDQVQEVGPYVNNRLKGKALRGKGVSLTDLNKFASAEKVLKESLKYDPENEITMNELHYVSELRVGGKRETSGILIKEKVKSNELPSNPLPSET